jgi:hypothetical protein
LICFITEQGLFGTAKPYNLQWRQRLMKELEKNDHTQDMYTMTSPNLFQQLRVRVGTQSQVNCLEVQR